MLPRLLAGTGAVLAAAAVGLAAYASHGVVPAAQGPLQIAAAFAFGHGLALAALARSAPGRIGLFALCLLLAGALAFCGALVARHLFGIDLGRLAPVGGSGLILGWLLYAVASIAHDRRP